MRLLLVLGWLVVALARQNVFKVLAPDPKSPRPTQPEPTAPDSPEPTQPDPTATAYPADPPPDTIPEDVETPGFSPDIIVKRKHVHGKKPKGDVSSDASTASGSGGSLTYHGGPVIKNVQISYIYYGDWSSRSAGQTYLNNFAQRIGGTPWYNIQTTYYDASRLPLSNSVAWGGSWSMGAVYGNSLTDATIISIVKYAVTNLGMPLVANGVYVVLTSSGVSETSGFCSQYCGWHNHASFNGIDFKYAFVGNAETQCPSSCIANTASLSGNGIGVDGMASVIAHELVEAASDPNLNAWYSSSGYENGDNCAWQFGPTITNSNGALYNMVLNGYKYLIQRNWVNVGSGYCSITY